MEDKQRMIHVRMSPDMHKKVRMLAADRDTNINKMVHELLERELAEVKA
jgi:predicted HicB family RNase H-like nuclease